MYTELDVNFLGLKVLNVGFHILQEPNSVLDKTDHTKLPEIIGWYLIWLAYQVLMEKYGDEIFNSFECPGGDKSTPILSALSVSLCWDF